MSAVRLKLIGLPILIAAASGFFVPQDRGPGATPTRIIIKLPDDVASDSVWIRYVVNRRISRGERIHLEGAAREYVIIDGQKSGSPPHNAKVVLYSPGCEFKSYEIDLSAGADMEKRFKCDPLPTKTVHGFIAPGDTPSPLAYQRPDKRVDIAAELEPYWICDFFLSPEGGSCLGSGVSLGIVGILDPANQGKFEITIPDFARDPAFRAMNTQNTNFGIIEMLLRDRKIGVPLEGIQPKTVTLAGRGLNVQAEYPDPKIFTKIR